jgi:hypothetical protein
VIAITGISNFDIPSPYIRIREAKKVSWEGDKMRTLEITQIDGIMIAKDVFAFIYAIFKRGAWFVGSWGNHSHHLGKPHIFNDVNLCKNFTDKLHLILSAAHSLKHEVVSQIIARKRISTIFFPFFILFLLTGFHELKAQEQFIRLAWSSNNEPHLSHYNLYRDTEPGTMVYLTKIDKSDTLYTDNQIVEGHTYYYKLTAVDDQGFESAPSNEVIAMAQAILGFEESEGKHTIIEQFELKQNYPNPFNPSTTIEYQVPEYAYLSIIIYSVLGKEVRSLVNDFKEAGTHQVKWDGIDNNGKQVSGGLYFYQMIAENFKTVKKLIFNK